MLRRTGARVQTQAHRVCAATLKNGERRVKIPDTVEIREGRFELRPIGRVDSRLADPATAPKQGDEGAPDAWVVLDPAVRPGLDGIERGDRIVVLTWLHLADREVLEVHPRDDPANPLRGVFATRSADRPNPIGLHEVEVLEVDGDRVRVGGLEAVDGTPVLDVKPVLRGG